MAMAERLGLPVTAGSDTHEPGSVGQAYTIFDAPVADAAALHALTIGAIGTITLGMMSRVALGHSGRPLQLRPAVVGAYWLMQLAALARVVVPIAVPQFTAQGVAVSGIAWSAAFAIFVIVFAPILTAPRADGRPG